MEEIRARSGRTAESPRPWPALWTMPPLAPLDREDLRDLQSGDRGSEATEAVAAAAARARGALDLALADRLADMRRGDRLIQLGFSGLRDYAREILGLSDRTAQSMVHLSRKLAERPLLRAAVARGEVPVRRAQAVLSVAVGEAEAEWVDRARALTVAALEDLVRTARAGPDQEDEEWRVFETGLSPEDRDVVDEALEVAGAELKDPRAPRAQRLEAMAQEYLGGHPIEAGEDDRPCGKESIRPREDALARYRAQLEVETQQWMTLVQVPSFSVPEAAFSETASAAEVDAEVRRLAAIRSSWDDLLGHCSLAVKSSGMCRTLGFSDFGHYTAERLGLAERTVEQRAALEKRLWEVPVLREAYNRRELSYEQTRLLSRLPEAEIPAWIPRAKGLTCIQLRRELETRKEAQLRAARRFVAPLPRSIALILAAAFEAARRAENQPLWSDGQCLVAVARHFVEVYGLARSRRRTRSQRIRERDRWNCQVPMCSRRAAHAHHVKPRGQLGPDTDDNLTGLCSCHHLRGVHDGYVRVSGTAPGGLVWELGGKVWVGPQRWEVPAWS